MPDSWRRHRASNGRHVAFRSSVVVAGVLTIGALLTNCGGDDSDDDAGASVQALPASVQGVIVDTTRGRPIAWARDIEHETAVAYALCALPGCTEIELIGLGGDADDVAAVDGVLWVAPASIGQEMRIVDPDASTVSSFGPPLATPSRIAPSGEFVFVASAFDLYRFDSSDPDAEPELITWTAANESVAAVVASADAVFVVGHAGEVARIDPESMDVTARGQVPGSVPRQGAVAIGPTGLYVATTDGGVDVLVRVDPVTLEIAARRELDSEVTDAAVTVIGDVVLVAGAELLELDPETLDVRDHLEPTTAVAVGVVAIEDRVWVVSPLGVTVVDR